jgi:hypothetical protein
MFDRILFLIMICIYSTFMWTQFPDNCPSGREKTPLRSHAVNAKGMPT